MAEKVKKVSFSSKSDDHEPRPEQLHEEVRRDMGKVALFISALAVVLMVVFYFVLNNNVSNLQATVRNFTAVDEQVSEMEGTIGQMQDSMSELDTQVADQDRSLSGLRERMGELENLPQETRNVIYASLLDDISQQAGFLSNQLQGEEQEQLQQAMELIRQIREGMATSSE
ncbi:MAG: hypothetical protein ACOC43_00420 [Desulfohalobiaceae bacterium]